MMSVAKFVFPLFGLGLLWFAVGLFVKFFDKPLPVHIAMTIGVMAIVGVAAFVGSALAWLESELTNARKEERDER